MDEINNSKGSGEIEFTGTMPSEMAGRFPIPREACPSFSKYSDIKDEKEMSMEMRIWCTKCDVDMVKKGIALDCPEDGLLYECPSCNYRIVSFKKRVDEFE